MRFPVTRGHAALRRPWLRVAAGYTIAEFERGILTSQPRSERTMEYEGLELQAIEGLVRALRPARPARESESATQQLRIPEEIRMVANAFVNLQEARHGADYDPRRRVTRRETLKLIEDAEQAFGNWEKCKKSSKTSDKTAVNLYLLSLLTFRRLRDR